MNCCDEYGNCNQGRNCPVRVAKVAKVNRRAPAAKPLPPSVWRYQLRHLAKWMLIVLAVMLVSALTVGAIR